MRIIFFLLLSLLSVAAYSWGDDKVYTNEDVEQYQQKREPSVAGVPKTSISYDELMRRSGKLEPLCTEEVKARLRSTGGDCVEMREGGSPVTGGQSKSLPDITGIDQRINEEVLMSISGCPTLQDGLDEKKGNSGHAVFKILRHGRTIQELCDTVGRGCSTCLQLPQAK